MKKKSPVSFTNNLVHPVRTTIAAVVALLLARLLALPEVYWAPISAIVVMESTLGATLALSWRRLIGTALGSATGALLLGYFGPSLLAMQAAYLVSAFFVAFCALKNPLIALRG